MSHLRQALHVRLAGEYELANNSTSAVTDTESVSVITC
jgi:hypothetical protein